VLFGWSIEWHADLCVVNAHPSQFYLLVRQRAFMLSWGQINDMLDSNIC
jgi:hypothetical protein